MSKLCPQFAYVTIQRILLSCSLDIHIYLFLFLNSLKKKLCRILKGCSKRRKKLTKHKKGVGLHERIYYYVNCHSLIAKNIVLACHLPKHPHNTIRLRGRKQPLLKQLTVLYYYIQSFTTNQLTVT